MKIKAVALDDEPLALKVIEAYCNRLDYIDLQKVFTKTGDAMEYLENFPVDLIFLDINMPGLNGLEVFSYFKREPYLANTAVFIVSSEAEREVIETALKLGARAYLMKPVSLDDLEQALRDAGLYYA